MRHGPTVGPHQVGPYRLVTVKQAAAAVGVTEWTVRAAIWEGVLPAVQIGRAVRVKPEDLDQWRAMRAAHCSVK
jgi:excisionase family DNA binding protein